MFQERLRQVGQSPQQPGSGPSSQTSSPTAGSPHKPIGPPPGFGPQAHRPRHPGSVPSSPVEGPFHPMMRPQTHSGGQIQSPTHMPTMSQAGTVARYPMMQQQLQQMRPGMAIGQRLPFGPGMPSGHIPVGAPRPPFSMEDGLRATTPGMTQSQTIPSPATAPGAPGQPPHGIRPPAPGVRPPLHANSAAMGSPAAKAALSSAASISSHPAVAGAAHRPSDDGEKSDDQLEDLFSSKHLLLSLTRSLY